MTATLHPNRTTPLAALWWLFDGATFSAFLFDASSASPVPGYDDLEAWNTYILDQEFDLFFTGGAVDFDASNTELARLPQLEVVLDYASAVTYTHVAVVAIPAVYPSALSSNKAIPVVAFIAEPSPVTLSSTQTKTYNIDITAFWS